jgi:hypothetical protein
MSNDIVLSDEDRAEFGPLWRNLVEDKAHRGRTHYSQPAIKGQPARGSFKIPRDVIESLGDGDPKAGGAIAHRMFGVEDEPDDPTTIDPNVVRLLGDGDIRGGQRVLEKFIRQVRGRDLTPQPDGNHGRRARHARA